MNNKIIILLAFLISFSNFAQSESINYKAVIKDDLGNVVVNQSMTIQFSILKGGLQTSVYVETHNPTTDDNGIAIVNIGEGATTDVFSDILWGSDDYFLKVQVDIGSGLTDMGTTQFEAVPFALNVTGLEALDEGNGKGWRLVGSSPIVYGAIGDNAIDLSIGGAPTNDHGATGSFSVAIGNQSRASGDESISIGSRTKAVAYRSTAMGSNNIGGGSNDTWVSGEPLFEIGNALSAESPSNALTVLKNGTITAPSFDLSEITDGKALITKEYLDANVPEAPSGLEQITEGSNTGWRLKGYNMNNYGPIGNNAVDLSTSNNPSTENGAIGNLSTALGQATKASGFVSFATGNQTNASSTSSTAMGFATQASGGTSTALGGNTMASGNFSTTMGYFTIASGEYSTAMGSINFDDPNALLMVGNGTNLSNRNNAFTVYKNGNSVFDGDVTVNNSLEVNDLDVNGTLIVSEKIRSPNTNNSNLIPVAYGNFDGGGTTTGNILSGTQNFTIERLPDFTYEITVLGESLSTTNSTASVTVSTDFFRTANITYSGGKMRVHIFSSNFVKVPAPFQFIIYKE